MKPGYSDIEIGFKRKPLSPDAKVSEMSAMPVPTQWGAPLTRPKGKGNKCLHKGTIIFERIDLRIIPRMPQEDEVEYIDPTLSIPEEERTSRVLEAEHEEEPMQPARALPDKNSDIGEYTHSSQADAIALEFNERSNSLFFRIAAVGLIFIFIALLEILPSVGVQVADMFLPEKAPQMYLIVNLVMFAIAAFLERSMFAGAISSLREKKFNADAMLSCASIATVVHIVVQLVSSFVEGVTSTETMRVFTAPILLGMLISDVGLLCINLRETKNFRYVASRRSFGAVFKACEIDNVPDLLRASGRDRSGVVYRTKAKFLHSFLQFSEETDYCESKLQALMPFVFIASVIAAVAGFLHGMSIYGGIYCFCASLATGIPACRSLCLNLPLCVAGSRLLKDDAMIIGWPAVEELGKTRTVALAAEDLFPDGSVEFVELHTKSRLGENEVFILAASLAIAAGGPLASAFDNIIEREHMILREVESLSYEDEMGITGYIGSRSVALGSRELMHKLNIATPSKDFESLITQKGGHSIFVAVSGQYVGVITVNYHADEKVQQALDWLVDEDIAILICTRDPNVNAQLVHDKYDIPKRCITVLEKTAGAQYDSLARVIKEKAPAILATNGTFYSFARGIRATCRLSRSLLASSFLQIICYCFALALMVVLCCLGGASAISPARVLILQAVCVVACSLGFIRSM